MIPGGQALRRRRGWAVLGAVGLLAAAAAATPGAVSPPPAAAAGCITRLPVTFALPSSFAASYRSSIPLRVTATGGHAIRGLRAELFTFGGDRIASGSSRAVLHSSATIRMRLPLGPMQVGAYTLVITGEPNASASCGPKQLTKALDFRGCFDQLPIAFVNPPGGAAADYGGYLSVALRASGALVRNLKGTVYSFDGTRFGDGTLSALFGTATLNLALNQALLPGGYTVVVTGTVNQPATCAAKTAQTVLKFE